MPGLHEPGTLPGMWTRSRLLLLLVFAAVALLAGACQASTPAGTPGASGARQPTAAEVAELKAVLRDQDLASRLQAALAPWTLRDRIEAARTKWTLYQRMTAALSNWSARREYVAFLHVAVTASASAMRAGPVDGLRLSPRAGSVLTAANQCAFQLPGDEEPPPQPSRHMLRWLQSGAATTEESAPLTQELEAWLDQLDHDINPPPVSPETQAWLEQQQLEHDTNPPPVSQELLDWYAQEQAADAQPPAFTDQLISWLDQYEHDTNPPPVSPETQAWLEQDAAAQAQAEAPPPLTEELTSWLDQLDHDINPPPVSPETQAWLDQYEHDTNPPPVSPETQAWLEQDWHDTHPPEMTQEQLDWYAQEWHDTHPPELTQEELDWMAHERQLEEQQATRDQPLDISDAEWTEIQSQLEHSRQQPQQPVACNWHIDQASALGHVTGQKCGDPTGQWVISGEYHPSGSSGTQKWVITINADGKTGTYVYTTKATSFGFVTLTGKTTGTVALTISASDGSADMLFTEQTHTYKATVPQGGSGQDQNAPLSPPFHQVWQAGGTC
ncbi:MAG TPA: hypothetical protein VF484_01250 [Candidatus Limnocylindrales bacterium]